MDFEAIKKAAQGYQADMSRFLRGGNFACSFYQMDNEYLIVRKQM